MTLKLAISFNQYIECTDLEMEKEVQIRVFMYQKSQFLIPNNFYKEYIPKILWAVTVLKWYNFWS